MRFQHILIAVFVAAIWGFNFVVVKTGLKELPPFLYGAGAGLAEASGSTENATAPSGTRYLSAVWCMSSGVIASTF